MITKIGRTLVVLACISLLSACGGGGSSPAGTGPTLPGGASGTRLAGIPLAASLVSADVTFGSPDAANDAADSELFFSTSCTDDVLAVVTNRRAIYAELPCDRALPESASSRFLGKPVEVRLVVASTSKVYLSSTAAGTVEFTVGRIWQAPD
jgi:hypothetical protein